MDYQQRSKEDLIGELVKLHQRVDQLESALNEEKARHQDITDIKKSGAISDKEECLRVLMNYNPCLVFIKDEAGRYVYLNETYEKRFVGSKDWYGKTDFDFWFQESAQLFRANDELILKSGQVYQYMEDSTGLDGNRYCWLCYKFPFIDSKNRKYLAGIGIDATRWVLAEEALRSSEEALNQSEKRYRELVKYAPNGICEIDYRNQRLLSANDAMCKATGYSREELLTMNPFDLLDDRSNLVFQTGIEQWLSGEEPKNSVDYLIKTKDGREIWAELNGSVTVDKNGQPLGATIISHNITDRKKAEEKARMENAITLGINHILHDALCCRNEEEWGRSCLNVALKLTGSKMGFISEINQQGYLNDIAISEMGLESCQIPGISYRKLLKNMKARGIYRRVLQEGIAFFTNDPGSHPDSIGLPAGHPPLNSFIGAPLLENGQVIGMIVLGNKTSGYADEDVDILEKLIPSIIQVLMRKRAEAALRASEAHKSYLIKLSDALHPLTDPIEIQFTACRILGNHIGANRVFYGDVINENQVIISRDYVNGVSSISSTSDATQFSRFAIDAYRSGEFVIIKDVSVDPRLSKDEISAYESVDTTASISLGLLKGGKWVAVFGVHSSSPRVWSKGEIELVKETAERTWVAVERARAEEEVRKSRNHLEEKVAERTRELSLERQRLLDVLETLDVNICLLTADYHITFANRAFRERFGESNGRPCYNYIFGNDKPCESCKSFQVLETGQPYHWLFSAPDGSIIDIHNYPFTDADGKSLILEMNMDITEKKKMEAELARLDRLNIIGEMAASIGHEIRNPMTSVRGFLQLLGSKKEYQNDRPYFDLIIEELDRANSIITEYLSMAKDKRVDLQPKSLDYLVTTLYPIIMSDANLREINIHLDLNNPPEPLIDVNEIRQLILNMVRNGLEAMSEQGTLTIGTMLEEESVLLYIKDEGHGLKPNVIGKLGTPFFTTKANGTGLGLAVCYSIAARHKAKIDFETGSSGTTFYVRFPLQSDQTNVAE